MSLTTSVNSTPISVQADNLMRRILRINDPSNPVEVADGLGRAYPLESAELNEEIQGLPIGPPGPALLPAMTPSMAGRELVQAQYNIQRDLDFLTGSSQLKEVQIELQSWGETLRTWIADGAAAVSQALDSNARDRVFSARRILLDYARVSRLVGALTPGLSIPYRRFARSLDEASGLLIVSLGEALAQIGFSGDRLLLQAPIAELSTRADAAAAALRNLTGSVNEAFNQSTWPWGLDGYRKLLRELEGAGHGDVRVLLTENGLRAFTDELINRASSVTGDGLRALAATQVVALERVKRLIQVATSLSNESPPLASFTTALELFVLTFEGGNAGRLIALGRPLLAAANLYSIGGIDNGTRILLDLVRLRSQIAQLNDSLFGTDLTQADAQAQFAADSCLYAIDLAIDLYAVGVSPDGQGRIERRAAAYGLFIWQLLTQTPSGLLQPGLAALLNTNLTDTLLPSGLPFGSSWPLNQAPATGAPTLALLEAALTQAIVDLGLSGGQSIYSVQASAVPPAAPSAAALTLINNDRDVIAQELRSLRTRHDGLQTLVNAITPGNFSVRTVMEATDQALRQAIDLLSASPRSRLVVPPPVEAALASGLRTRPFTAPQVAGVNPATGPATGGTQVTVFGSGLSGASAVEFGRGNLSTSINVVSDAQIIATSPPGTGIEDIRVTTGAGISQTTRADEFEYLPEITGLAPNAGPETGSTLVTISGTGFSNITSVEFGSGRPAAGFIVASDTEIVATSPAGLGIVIVSVTAQNGASASVPSAQYTYLPRPTISSLRPFTGSRKGGEQVVINGSGLTPVVNVLFGATAATQFKVISDTLIVAIAPSSGRAQGQVDVSVVSPDGGSAPQSYTYV